VGALATFPANINTAGVITGTYTVASGYQGFERAANGTITTYVVPGATPGGWMAFLMGPSHGLPLGTAGLGINTAGNIAGFYSDSSDVYHGFLRTP
jgi:hypothetical protein